MPRTSAHTSAKIIEAAMRHFWQHGYRATSMDDLVKATGGNRHAIYSGVGSKSDLYQLGFAAYRRAIVDPAIAHVEAPDANLASIARYFETQIALAEHSGLPGPGCLIANAMTETAPSDPQIATEVLAHNSRLKAVFVGALTNEGSTLTTSELEALSDFIVITAQGLWSMSRTVTTAAPLRAHVSTLMSLLQRRLTP